MARDPLRRARARSSSHDDLSNSAAGALVLASSASSYWANNMAWIGETPETYDRLPYFLRGSRRLDGDEDVFDAELFDPAYFLEPDIFCLFTPRTDARSLQRLKPWPMPITGGRVSRPAFESMIKRG
jgi:hypothetical protein